MGVTTLTPENFKEEVLGSGQPVLVDFWAEWCPPCQMQGPVVEQAAEQMPDVKFAKLNADEGGDIVQEYGIRNIPTLILFKDGKEAGRKVGYQSMDQLEEFIKGTA